MTLRILLLLALSCGWAKGESQKPNVLFIVIDDMNDGISLLDPKSPIKTPNLERLAKRGTLFTRAYCISAACNPSRVATLTGLRPSTSGVYRNNSDWRKALPKRKTIMQQFRSAGYAVRGAGKIFHHKLEGAFHDNASFDDFLPMAPQNMPAKKLNNAPEYGSRNTDWGIWPKDEKDTIDFRTTEYCIRNLKNPPKNRPIFLACGIFKPHSPFFAPPNYHEALPPIPKPKRLENDWSDLPSGAQNLMNRTKWFWRGMSQLERKTPGSYAAFLEAYAACCRFADAQVGRLLDALDNSPIAKNTIVVLWSDHGFHLGEKDHIEKFALWEKANHVPFIISAPGVAKPGSVCETPVDLTVLYPTLLELCGIQTSDKCDGPSAVPLLRDPGALWPYPAISTYGKGNHTIRTKRWRYIRYADGSEELYNHDYDPNEWTNLAKQPSMVPTLSKLRARIALGQAADAVSDLRR
ncbi:MAG: sulfatase [Verrucomicrobia bacterium]|nr:sulfatase [Verrucomicrobiota bacterium]